jgi:CheY-like chemotaxis protein
MASGTERSAERVVLVVDDNPDMRTYMVRALAAAGFRVLMAADGEQALAILDSLGPSVIWLVVSDVAMPGMTGLRLAATIEERWPSIPVLLVSAALPVHWNGPFISKPFTPNQLVTAAEDLLPPAEERTVAGGST